MENKINLSAYQSLPDFVQQQCKTFAELPAFENFGAQLTFKELEEKSLKFAAYLQHLGFKKGERFAIMLPNVMQFPIALYGILRAGLVVVNVNPLYTVKEFTHQMNDSGAKGILVMENFTKTISEALPLASLKHVISTTMGDCLPWAKKHLINGYLKYIKHAIPDQQIPNAISFEAIFSEERPFREPNIHLDDIAFLQYTGGTTGIAKGAVLTHKNVLANVLQCLHWVKPKLQIGKDIVIMPLPLYHIFSLTSCFFFMVVGAKSILVTDPRNIPQFIHLLSHNDFTILLGLNTLFSALMRHPKFKQIDFSQVSFIFSGGMALQKAVAQRWRELTNTHITEGYGLTEASPVVTINSLEYQPFTGSIGFAIAETEISIRDDANQELPMGEVGELFVRGPQVMKGYWNNPSETADVLSLDGWLKTGDMAKIDSNGKIYIVDRKKDLIIVSGFNVYPNEVEEVLVSHPQIKEAAVIGVPSERSGEVIKAFIVRENPDLSPKEIRQFCMESLTHYKIPREFEFCEALPKSAVGKVLRKALRKPT